MWKRCICLVFLSGALVGCAVNVPHLGGKPGSEKSQEIWEGDLIEHVECELKTAIVGTRAEWDAQHGNTLNKTNKPFFLDGWGAKVNLTMQVDVKSTTNPSLTWTDPLQNALKTFPENGNITIARSRAFGIGINASRQITREEVVGYLYDFADFNWAAATPLSPEMPPSKYIAQECKATDLVPNNDLRIYDFLHAKMLLAARDGALPAADPKSKYETLTFQVKFIVTQSASINPSWKLVELAINPGNSLLYNGQRVRSNTLLITFGKVKAKEPDQSLRDQHLANLIGQAVGDQLKQQN